MENASLVFRKYATREYVYSRPCTSQEFLFSLDDLRESELLTDIRVIASGDANHRGMYHRVVLAVFSPYFKALFSHHKSSDMKQTVELPGLPSESVHSLLNFMYTGQLTITKTNVIDILETAEFLQMRDIVEVCAMLLLEHIDDNNSIQLEHLGHSHLCRGLADTARTHTLRNFTSAINTSTFREISVNDFLDYLQDEKLKVDSEFELLRGLCYWCQHEWEYRNSEISQLFQYVNFSQIESSQLDEIIAEFPALSDCIKTFCKQCNGEDSILGVRFHQALVVVSDVCPAMDQKSGGLKHSRDMYFLQPGESKWSYLTQLPFKWRTQFSVDVLENMVYLCGGEEWDIVTKEVLMYSVTDHKWSKITDMLHPRSNHASAVLHNCLYVIGGKTLRENQLGYFTETEMFDPLSQQWTRMKPMSSPGMGLAMARCSVVPLGDSLFVFGEVIVDSSAETLVPLSKTTTYTNMAKCYNVNTREWSDVPKLRQYIEEKKFSVGTKDCLPYQGCILIIDDRPSGKNTLLYHPVSGVLDDFIGSQGQHRFGGHTILDHTLYSCGGCYASFPGHDVVHSHSLIEGDKGWNLVACLPKPLARCTAHVVSILQQNP